MRLLQFKYCGGSGESNGLDAVNESETYLHVNVNILPYLSPVNYFCSRSLTWKLESKVAAIQKQSYTMQCHDAVSH